VYLEVEMKLQAQGVPVEKIGVGEAEESDFVIHNSAIAFRILSSGLYSDPIRAILRELGTNALDAHIQAGKPNQPFKIHIPTKFEPWFSIKDEGVGMTEEQVRTNYCGYFGSTKLGSNDEAGCFGLGSKSPFSYTETFTVITVKDGIKRTFTAYVSEEGKPRVNKLSEEETEEPNGVEVMFPIQLHHFYDFQSKAQIVYQDFKVWPESNVKLSMTRMTYNPQGDAVYVTPSGEEHSIHWGIRENARYGAGICSGVRIIQGPVAYPLDVSQIDFRHPMLSSDMDIVVPMGDVMITPSRESLNYTEYTKGNLRSIFETIGKTIADAYIQEINKCKKRIEALILLNRWRIENSQLYNVIYEVATQSVFDNFKIKQDYVEIDQTQFLGVGLYRLDRDRWSGRNRYTMKPYFDSKKERLDCKKGCGWIDRMKKFTVNKEVVIVFNDGKKAGFRALIERMEDSKDFDDKRIFSATPTKDVEMQANGKNKWVDDPNALEDAVALAAEFDAEILLASEMMVKYPAPKNEKKAKTQVTRTRLFEETQRADWTKGHKWTAMGVDAALEDKGGEVKYFVYISGVSVKDTYSWGMKTLTKDDGTTIQVSVPRMTLEYNDDLAKLLESLEKFQILDEGEPIFGVNIKDKDKIKDNEEWVNILDYTREYLKGMKGKDVEGLSIYMSPHAEALGKLLNHSLHPDLKGSRLKSTVSAFQGLLKVINEIHTDNYYERIKVRDKFEGLCSLFKKFELEMPQLNDELKNAIAQVKAFYPWLFDRDFSDSASADKIRQYVITCDSLQEAREKIYKLESELAEAMAYA
jgi:hypothetical protein